MFKKMVKEGGVDWLIDNLPPEDLKKLKERLKWHVRSAAVGRIHHGPCSWSRLVFPHPRGVNDYFPVGVRAGKETQTSAQRRHHLLPTTWATPTSAASARKDQDAATSTAWRRKGMRFTSFYVAQAVCSASRAALADRLLSQSRRHPRRAGPGRQERHRRTTRRRSPRCSRPRGYATAISASGTWAICPSIPAHAPRLRRILRPALLQRHVAQASRRRKFPDLPLIEGDKDHRAQSRPERSSPPLHRAGRRVHRAATRTAVLPLCAAHHAARAAASSPKVQGQVAARPLRRRRRGNRLVRRPDPGTLQTLGLDDNTLVIFTSDNGPWLSYGNHAGSAGRCAKAKAPPGRAACACRSLRAGPANSRRQDQRRTRHDDRPAAHDRHASPAPSFPTARSTAKTSGRFFSATRREEPARGVLLLLGQRTASRPFRPLEALFPAHLSHHVGNELGKDGQPGLYKNVKAGQELFNLER